MTRWTSNRCARAPDPGRACAADTGIAIVPNALRALQLPGLRYLTLTDPGAFSTVSAISRTDHENNPVVDRFLSVARAG
ncbi:hypothetical protein [Amycolatopsis sp. VC5-11]|uniref:hypothetical protein n=1 Tax=Amycolatopsis sp. VC5-11 TaxID=3120156 RepID=UPI00300A9F8F